MEVGNAATRCFQGIEEAIGRRSGISNTNGGRQVLHWSRSEQRHNRHRLVTGIGQKMAPSHLPIQIPNSYGTKLRNLQQRTTHDHACSGWVEALPNGSSSGFQNLDRSPESPVLPETPKAEPLTSTLGNRIGRIPLLSSPQTRNGKQESWPA